MKKIVCVLEILFFIAAVFCLFNYAYYKYFLLCAISVYILDFVNKRLKDDSPSLFQNDDECQENDYLSNDIIYLAKPFLTSYEMNFYNKIKDLEDQYIIVPQVNLASIIDKPGSKYRNELFRNIDFGIFTKDFKLLLLIEIDDHSHTQINRRDRDLKVKKILEDCNIPLIKFYTYYSNEKNYVINRIRKCLNEITLADNALEHNVIEQNQDKTDYES